MDVSDIVSIKTAAKEVAELAPQGIDILINNAGVDGDGHVNTLNITRQDYLKVFEINVFGVSDTTQAFLPLLRQRGQDKTKKVLNMSSVLGSITLISRYSGISIDVGPATSMSKAALNMLIEMAADDLAKENFIVTSVHLGWVKTDLGTEKADVTVDVSIKGMLNLLDNLTAKHNGEFFNYDGSVLPW